MITKQATKVCYKCKTKKSLKEFGQFKTGKNRGYFRSYCKKCDNKLRKEWTKKYRKDILWAAHYFSAKARCTNSKNRKYPRYGGRGIKFLMTLKDFKTLWFRDKAYLLERPSIDRKNNNGHYVLVNCRFIELKENSRLGRLQR